MTYLYDYHKDIEGILAKKALAECEFCNNRAATIAGSVVDAVAGVLTTAVISAQTSAESSGIYWLVDPLTAIYRINAGVNSIIPVADLYSDSQPTVPSQAIRMRDARIISQRARQHAARLFPIEEPFLPEEPSTRPHSRDVSRVIKLEKRR